jgi:hypothetical protein
MGDALAEATGLMVELLGLELDPDEDELASEKLLPDRLEDVNVDEAVAEPVAEEVAEDVTEEVVLAVGDDPGRLVELGEAVEDVDERLVDAEADPGEEVTEAVTELEVEEVSSSGSGVSLGSPSSSVMVELGVSSPSVMDISPSSLEVDVGASSTAWEDVDVVLATGVMLADGVSMTMELTLVVLGLTTADGDIAEDDFVVVVVVVGPMEVLLPGMRLRWTSLSSLGVRRPADFLKEQNPPVPPPPNALYVIDTQPTVFSHSSTHNE